MSVDLQLVLTNYLESHKRLVIPQLGAFLVKEPGKSILFSELMKRDDGVLHGLLCARGMNEIEASGCIDRFVYEVRRAVEEGGTYPLPGFGTMQPGPNGTIAFVYEAAPAAIPVQPTVAAGPEPAEDPEAARPDSDKPSHIDTARMAETMRTAFRAERTAADDAESGEIPPAREPAPRRKPAYTLEEAYAEPVKPKRKVDRFLLIAVAAALIALAAIAFGFWRDAQEQQDEEPWPLEQPAIPESPLE